MTSAVTSAPYRPLVRVGCVLLGLAALLGLVAAVLVLGPAQALNQRADIGSTLVVDVPADRDWAVYSTLSTWRAALCDVTAADGRPIVLRPDMVQQTLHGWPTWYPQGSFELDRAQQLTVRCEGPPGQFAVGRSVGLGHLLLTLGVGLVAVLVAVAGLGPGDRGHGTPKSSVRCRSSKWLGGQQTPTGQIRATGHGSRSPRVVRPRCW